MKAQRREFVETVNITAKAASALFAFVRHEEPWRVAYYEISRLGFLGLLEFKRSDKTAHGEDGGDHAVERLVYERRKNRFTASDYAAGLHRRFWLIAMYTLEIENVIHMAERHVCVAANNRVL